MHIPKLLAPLFALLLFAGVLPGAAFADSSQAVDLFIGTATTGVGAPSPVDINPRDISIRASDGAVGVGYIYRATGNAFGTIGGRIEYTEHGYLFFKNPSDPSTFVDSRYAGGQFTLFPGEDHRAPIIISDTDPSAYRSGVTTMPLAAAHGVSEAYAATLKKLGVLSPAHNTVSYGFFTFTNSFGTQTGYATPDFRQFSIRLKFVP